MSRFLKGAVGVLAAWTALTALHGPVLRLPYYWDEAGYYVPAALDLWRHGLLIPKSTLPTGHTPLVMAYLALAWSAFGFSSLTTRLAMLLVAGVTVVATYRLAHAVLGEGPHTPEAATWSAALLSVTPLFFAQSSLVHLDLSAALFTLLALAALLGERWRWFAVTASLAVLSKETAVVLVPVASLFVWHESDKKGRRLRKEVWLALLSPCLVLGVWALYYHHQTGYWTGNPVYLKYNLYSTLSPVRIALRLLRRLYEVGIGGFNWMLVSAALAGGWWSRKERLRRPCRPVETAMGNSLSRVHTDAVETGSRLEPRFFFLAALLTAAYIVMLSVVGGAILPRYLLPLFPPIVVVAILFVWRLPRAAARACCVVAAACLVSSWFINPPYPFPFEDNLAYADFVLLHQQAARYLAVPYGAEAGARRILTAWPASDELDRPQLGYVSRPLHVVPVDGFTAADFDTVAPGSFDLVYIYSRKWEPSGNLVARFSWVGRLQRRYFDYAPQVSEAELAARFHLKPVARWERRGQWVAIDKVDSPN